MLSSFHTDPVPYDFPLVGFVGVVATVLVSVQVRLLHSLQDLLEEEVELLLVSLAPPLQQTRPRYHQGQTSLAQILHSTEILHLFVILEIIVVVEAVDLFVVLDINFAVTVQLIRVVLSLPLSIPLL